MLFHMPALPTASLRGRRPVSTAGQALWPLRVPPVWEWSRPLLQGSPRPSGALPLPRRRRLWQGLRGGATPPGEATRGSQKVAPAHLDQEQPAPGPGRASAEGEGSVAIESQERPRDPPPAPSRSRPRPHLPRPAQSRPQGSGQACGEVAWTPLDPAPRRRPPLAGESRAPGPDVKDTLPGSGSPCPAREPARRPGPAVPSERRAQSRRPRPRWRLPRRAPRRAGGGGVGGARRAAGCGG